MHEYCKTRYAAQVSLDHFVRCHERVVLLLDLWRRSSIRVRVHDEGAFWKTRSREALAAHLGDYITFLQVARTYIWE